MKAFWPLLVCVLSGTAWAGEFPQVEVPVVGDGTPGPYSLGGHIVVEGTEEVYRRGERLDEGEYNLDGGELRLGFPLPVGDTLLVRFRTVLLRRSYRLWTPKAPEDAGRVPRRPPPPPSPSQDQVRLCVGGSKSIGVVVGSGQGLSLEQSLHLDISGEVGGAKVTAVLSDQDLPFQPEGTTQKLEEIDRVLVRVSGGGLSATFGDYELKWEEGQFGRYSRRLEGVLGKVRSGSLELSVVAAASKGTFCTNSFQGREGDQGPYQLHAEDGDEAIVVLAGTERVWVDGERMERGANRDYIIDYAAAQVTFTPRRLIASDSRIVVDFSYIRRHYPRTTLAAKGRMRLLEGKVQAFGLWIREAEDGRNPVDFSLTPEALTALRGAGDDPRKAGFPGAEPMQGGAYRAVRDEGGREYYEYVGEGLGTHRVRFWFVGEGKGEYRYLGAGVYRYVGPGEGSYLPGTFLPLPERRELWTVGLRLQPLDGVYAEGEWAASVWDRNVLSPSDDGDNMGTAYRLDLRAGKGPWEVQGVLRRTGKRFSPLDRVYGADRERDWGFPSSMPLGEEREGEVSAAYRPTQHTGVRLRYARLKRGSDISVRRGVEVWTREPGRPEVRLLEERIRGSSGPILRRRATLRYRWYIDPYLSYELESAPFLRYYRWEGGASVRGEGWEGEVGYGRRGDVRPATASSTWFRARLEVADRNRSLKGGYIRRNMLEEGGRPHVTSSGWVRLHLPLLERTLVLSLDGERSDRRLPGREETFLYVGPGRGGYSWEDRDGDGTREEGEFFPDPEGDYIRYLAPVRSYRPVREDRLGLRFRLDPRWRIPFSSEISAYGTWGRLREGGVLKRRLSLDQALELFRGSRWGSIRAFYRGEHELDRSFEGGERRESLREVGARLRLFQGRAEVEAEVKRGRRERHTPFEDYRISGGSFSGRYSLRFGGGRIGGKVEVGREGELERDIRADYVAVRPEGEYSRGDSGVWGYVKATWVWAPSNIPYEMARGRRAGLNLEWALRLSRNVSRFTTLSLSYTGRKWPGRRASHTARMEVRATF